MSGLLKEKFLDEIYDMIVDHKSWIDWGGKEAFKKADLIWEDLYRRIEQFQKDTLDEANKRL